MTALTGTDICARITELSATRVEFESVWRQVAEVAATDAPEFGFGVNGVPDLGIYRANAARRSRNLYDATAAWAQDRLASGLEGLIMPQSELWHGLGITDLFSMSHEASDEEVEWLEALTKYLFRVRYDAGSGFVTAMQTALRRLVGFGNGLFLIEEGPIGGPLIRYRHLPLSDTYFTEDHWGRLDGVWRYYSLTARQAKQKLEEGKFITLPASVLKAASEPGNCDKPFRFVHCIAPRADFGAYGDGIQKAPWGSYHVSYDDHSIVGVSGYWEFPVVDFRWLPEPGRLYGEGPIMRVLADIQSLNLMARNEMIASQQAIDPPLLVARNGVVNRPDTNPGAIIAGGIDAQGREAVKPLDLHQRIDLSQAVIQAKRENLRESLYINLFATMVKTPRMSATESMIRAGEKGELLGPAGSRIQESLSRMVDRELGILARYGLFDQNSLFKPPSSLRNREIGPKFRSPLERMRRSKEAEGIMRTIETVMPIAQINHEILDHFDTDDMTRTLAEVLGAPRKTIRRTEEVQQIRQARAIAQQQDRMLAQTQASAAAAKDAVPALAQLNEMGNIAA